MRIAAFGIATHRVRSALANQSASEVDDAVLAVALQRYLITRRQHGERLTETAAAGVVRLARAMGLNTSATLQELGFVVANTRVLPLDRERLIAALHLLRKHDRVSAVHTLCGECIHVKVKDLERLG